MGLVEVVTAEVPSWAITDEALVHPVEERTLVGNFVTVVIKIMFFEYKDYY